MLIADRLKEEQTRLSSKIIELKKRNNFSQKQLSENSYLNIRVIRRIEKGEANPELKTLLRLAIALKTKTTNLFDYDSKAKFVAKNYGKYDFEKLLILEKKKLGNRILQLCSHRGIDQEELGVLSRIASSDISHYINGEENLVLLTLLKISIGLEIRMSELFDYNGKMPENVFQGKIQF